MTIETHDAYWDCDCPTNYIHAKKDRSRCPKCYTNEKDMPDSRVDELLDKNMF